MGLDWYVEPKEENGRRIKPSETAGLKYLDRNDAESIAIFQDIYDHNKASYQDPGPPPEPEAKPGGLKGLFDGISRAGRERRYMNQIARQRWEAKKRCHDHWNRPFATVLDETLNADEPFVVQYAAPDREDALADFLGTGDFYDFRPHELMEEYNAVGAFALYEEGESWPHMLAIDRNPEEMLELADEIEGSLKAFREAGRDKAGEDDDPEELKFSIEIAEAVIPWLHSIKSDW
jgi:hypothetical protein